MPLIFVDRNQNIVFFNINEERKVPSAFIEFFDLISQLIEFRWDVSDYDRNLLCSVLEERMLDVKNFFVTKNGEFINKLYDSFHDEISRRSFATYIEQRILSNIQCGYEIAYPVPPPPKKK